MYCWLGRKEDQTAEIFKRSLSPAKGPDTDQTERWKPLMEVCANLAGPILGIWGVLYQKMCISFFLFFLTSTNNL